MAITEQYLEDFRKNKMDAVGEIQNITMGAAATAVSSLLNAKVWITTPQVDLCKGSDILFPELEPAIHVRIEYIEGISGFSLLVLKQNDVQLILNQLMGLPLVVTDDFEFDEINISAVSEVMNQMMGASATALSEILGYRTDISTPLATVSEGEMQSEIIKKQNINPDDYLCTVTFSLTIDGVINSKFVTLLDLELASKMADTMTNNFSEHLDNYNNPEPAPAVVAEPEPAVSSPTPVAATAATAPAIPVPAPPPPPPPVETPVNTPASIPEFTPPPPPVYAPPQAVPQTPPPPPPAPYAYPQQQTYAPPPPQYMPPPPQYYQPPPPHLMQTANPLASIDTSKFTKEQIRNLQLLMNVPMDVSIEIGATTKRVDEILDFSQGTVFELDRAATAPVDIVVNGNLIAKGEVVVLDDNFAVKIIEINQANMTDMLSEKVS